MAIRGAKPKPALLRLVGGNAGKRPIPPDVQVDPGYNNQIEPPTRLRKREREVWDAFVRPLPWLQPADSAMAFLFVRLFTQFEKSPDMVAGKIAQLRASAAEIGITPASRTRLAATSSAQRDKDDPCMKYLR